MAKELGERIAVCKVDAAKYKKFNKENEVTGVPALFMFKYGKKIKYRGSRTAESVLKWVDEELE